MRREEREMKKERRGRERGRGQQRFATSFLAVGELDDDPRICVRRQLREIRITD